MIMKSVFDFLNYKVYLEFVEDSRKSYQRGFRSKLAEFIGCQSGYISHVLNGKAHLSLEQTLRVAKFLGLKPSEQKYLLLLVELARAGTSELKSHFEDELRLLRDRHLNIKERVGGSLALSETDQSIYYSSWHYLAVHVLRSLPEYNDAKSIAQALKIPDEVAGRVLLFLIQANIITESKGVLKSGLTQVHLNRESPLIRQHHTNWRIAAIQSLMNDERNDVHYSTVSTLSKVDAEKLKTEMIKLIEHYVATVQPSPEEVMYGFNLDFYSLIKK
jgi:uncharacterized protein (TIGR02147 family)